MKRFQSNKAVLGSSREAKRIVKAYNKVARTLVAFEYLWYEAWCKSVDAAKAGLRGDAHHPAPAARQSTRQLRRSGLATH